MNFTEALQHLNNGSAIRMESWSEGTFLYAQVPNEVSIDTIPKMNSLSESVKELMQSRMKPLKFDNQINVVDENNSITSFVPTIEQLNAINWEVLKPVWN